MNKRQKMHIFHMFALFIAVGLIVYLFMRLVEVNRVLGYTLFAILFWLIAFGSYYSHGKVLAIMEDGLRKIQKNLKAVETNSPEQVRKKTFKLFYLFRLSSLFNNFSREIENSVQSIQNMNQELERVITFKTRTLEAIFNVSNHFMIGNDAENIYTLILNSAIDVIESATGGSFLFLDIESNRYYYKACQGYDFNRLKHVSFLFEETFLFANANGCYDAPVIIKNVPQWDADLLEPAKRDNIQAAGGLEICEALSAPIIIDDKIIAILNIDSDQSDAFDELDKQLIHFFASQIAISLKNKKLVEETVTLSRFDKLTGAYNRNYFEKIFSEHRTQSLENMESYALVLCDLNYLKIINDSFGHSAGDLVLTEFSKTIRSGIRDTDIFSRIGGDEFIILLGKITFAQAEEKMATIFKRFEDLTVPYLGHELPVSFSYGIAVSPDDSMVYDILVKIADMRMYNFKEQYKNEHPELLNIIGTF